MRRGLLLTKQEGRGERNTGRKGTNHEGKGKGKRGKRKRRDEGRRKKGEGENTLTKKGKKQNGKKQIQGPARELASLAPPRRGGQLCSATKNLKYPPMPTIGVLK